MKQELLGSWIADWLLKAFLYVGLAFESLSAVLAPTTGRPHSKPPANHPLRPKGSMDAAVG